MTQLGGILVDLEGIEHESIPRYLTELRDRFGTTVPIDIRAEASVHADRSASIRWHRFDGRALAIASARAARRGHLLIVFAPILPDAAIVQGLMDAFEVDEMVGFTQPRFSDAADDALWLLPDNNEQSAQRLPRQSLWLLPKTYLMTEKLAGCVGVRRSVAEMISTDSELNLAKGLLQEMRAARRRGFRNLVLNRLVVQSTPSRASAYPLHGAPALTGGRLLQTRSADEWFDGGLHSRRERLVAKASRARPSDKLSVLLDCRGAVPHHNGTSEAMFGLLEGLKKENPAWEVETLFTPEAAAYHQVAARLPSMRVSTTLPEKCYAAAVCLNQPWHLSTVKQLHNLALSVTFNMLDTIAWDVVYLANPDVDKVWHFIAEHADGLCFISAFTQERFNFRFSVAKAVRQAVARLSLSQADYRDPAVAALHEGDHILVFGNHYDHKAVAPTTELLSGAFPFQRIQTVGVKSQHLHNVKVFQSGHLPPSEIDRLIATARLVVFPSYYEGFGFPVVQALAYGRTVLVRSSSLWHELAGLMRMPGKLVEFVTAQDLVEAVGQIIAGEQPRILSFGQGLTDEEEPPGWDACARSLIRVLEASLKSAEPERWYERDRALAMMTGG